MLKKKGNIYMVNKFKVINKKFKKKYINFIIYFHSYKQDKII